MTHMKLFHRNEVADVSGEYLIVMSELDGNEWVPNRVQTADTLAELKEILRRTSADGGGIVVRGSGQFERLAFELGLRHLKSEWGNQ
jgi:hypothetical protein